MSGQTPTAVSALPTDSIARLRCLDRLMERSPAIVVLWRCDPEFTVEYVTGNVRLFGYDPEDFYTGRVKWVDIAWPEDVPRLRQELERGLAAPIDSWAQEYRLLGRDGKLRWIENRNQVIRDSAGAVTHIQGAILDVSERKRIEAALDASRQTFASIVERSRDGILVIDRTGIVVFLNEAAKRMFSSRTDSLLGRALPFVCDPDRPTRIAITRHEGALGIGEAGATATEWGRCEATLVTIRDITAQMTAEEQLQQQRAMAVRGDRLRSLGEMAASIAHEINQPLTGIRGGAEHLLLASRRGWDLEPEILQERLAHIMGQVDRLEKVVRHVRQFAHVPSRIDRCRISLNEVAASAVSMDRMQFSDHSVDLALEPAAELPEIVANAAAVEEMLHNLLANARYAAEAQAHSGSGAADPPRVIVRTGHDAEAAAVWIAVIDNGTGISARHLPYVFEPFFTTKPPDQGTGLGLSLVRRMAAEFAGQVELDSAPGRGTTATLRFPVAPPATANWGSRPELR